ncbi:YdeI family protein [Microbulbifer sp. THAF38]|uniref:YdeI/OmpD-associated family protein n=1 Tax=Microbulbifer sp. THAF38 TaxID=2587856 RepID=UPI0012AA1947|nr:YdeI/OmpD-associated family protein [Microbulbifer sp. THAF38]QFT54863.1 hypothetical protein FIU95_09880 [Microbulbifer sp. THAF38]
MMITVIEDFFNKGCGRCDRFNTSSCSSFIWRDGIHKLRRICLENELVEVVKWAHPCYMHANRNIVMIGAVRNDFRLIFFNASLMKDPYGILERQGENTQSPDMMRFTNAKQVDDKAYIIQSYLLESIRYAAEGIRPSKKREKQCLPVELAEALSTDAELAQAFYNLTPGRQKSYIIKLNSAKKSETRAAYIAKFRSKIMSGKGPQEQ